MTQENMQPLREERDADRAEEFTAYSEHMSLEHPNEIVCTECGQHLFVDDLTFEQMESAAVEGFEDGFLCDDCSETGEEALYAHR